jgi:hypothetical protein
MGTIFEDIIFGPSVFMELWKEYTTNDEDRTLKAPERAKSIKPTANNRKIQR